MTRSVPDRWVVVEVNDIESKTTVRKVLAGWYGGYGGGDSYQLSSAIQRVDDLGDRYEFHNHSGSVYICHKNSYGMSNYMAETYNTYKALMAENNRGSMSIVREFNPKID